MLATAHVVYLSAGVGLAEVVHGKVDDAHVNAECIIGADQGHIVRVARGGQHPLSTHQHQINLSFGPLEQVTLAISAGEIDALAACKRPYRRGVLSRQKPEYRFVVGLGGVAVEAAAGLAFASLDPTSTL